MSPDPVVAFPLDYYQILGLPPQCAFGLVESAYTDRVAQAPRREFSAALLAARERLLKDASTVLQDPVLRERYHRDQPAGTLKLEPSELAVGLLFLFELGKYQPILEREAEALKADNQDVRLVLALTHRMLALDAYRQGALSLACQEVEAALSILSGGGSLLGVQQELQALIKRWRPERILQLLAAPVEPENQLQRRAGFVLLSEVLDEREGIEGAGNDQSGLSREEFVQFVQYVRLRLTVAEQLELFEREAARPSPAAQYLAVQALLARGYTACDPPCVRRARGHLIKLAQRQDVYIELALCALLLGQTEEALKNIERSGEQPATEYIANLSLGAPDQLPGLCR